MKGRIGNSTISILLVGMMSFSAAVAGSHAEPLEESMTRNWLSEVQNTIQQQEYSVTMQKTGESGEGAGVYHAPNRAQGFRTWFNERGIRIVPRIIDNQPWELNLEPIRYGRVGYFSDCSGATHMVDEAQIRYVRVDLEEVYVNKADGLQHTIILDKSTRGGTGPFILEMHLKGNLGPRISSDRRTVSFVRKGAGTILEYGPVEVRDSLGSEVPTHFELSERDSILRFVIDDSAAAYPLTIRSVITTPDWIGGINQAGAGFGISVSSAGDVNNDGFSDVIVGAYTYDNGNQNEGAAFVYHGSASGLATSYSWTDEADKTWAYFGYSVSSAGDVNNDGFDDVIVGAHGYDNGQSMEGVAFVYHGSAIGLSASYNWMGESNQAGAAYGMSVSSAGDVNNDGYDDVIVGAPYYDNGEANEGLAFVYHGSSTGLSTSYAWIGEINIASAYFGYSVSSAGDVNHDGYSDVVIGAYYYSNGQTNEGAVFVYHGSSTGLSTSYSWMIEGNQASAQFGWSVACAGDVNGDSYSDIIIGSYLSCSGQVLVYHGSATGVQASYSWSGANPQGGSYYGFSVSSAGDVNNDGYSDVLVGAPHYSNGETTEGAVVLYLGSGLGLYSDPDKVLEIDYAGAEFGYSVSSAGDVNNDGYDDILGGAPAYVGPGSTGGGAFLFLGTSSEFDPDSIWTAYGDQLNGHFGWDVSTAGDVNGDGYGDVIIGARLYDNGQADEGVAYVFYGSAMGLATTYAWMAECNNAGAHFGEFVSSAGDVNGDGYSDVIVAARYYDNGQTDEGAAFLYHGSALGLSPSPDWLFETDQTDAWVSFVSSAGDVNGDGYSDIVLASDKYDSGQTDEGVAFGFYGSSTGLSATYDWLVEGDQASAYFGFASSAGDVNGDGYSDVIVGAGGYDNGETDEGMVYLYYGSSTGLATSAAWSYDSNQNGAALGSVSSAGDVNGDGYSDIIVGSYLYDNGETDEGAVFVFHGSETGLSASYDWMVESNQASSNFGMAVSTAGDVNGDGFGDVIIGAYKYDHGETDEGAAFVFLGSSSGLNTSYDRMVESNQAISIFGYNVASAGDVNGDGFGDVIVSAAFYDNPSSNQGAAFVYHGSAKGIATTSGWIGDSNQISAYFGISVASAGDVNGDGYSDVIIGAHNYDNGETNEGAAFVYHGSDMGLESTYAWMAEGNQASAYFGVSLSSAGDVNGDGYSDVIIGAYNYSNGETGEGAAFVFHGSDIGLENTYSWMGESNQSDARYGWSVSSAGDINADGFGDVIVAAYMFDNGETNEGAVWVYHGSSTGLSNSSDWMTEGNQESSNFGFSVASAGDVNRDGYSDIIIGASLYDHGQTDEGAAFVFHGSSTGLSSAYDTMVESNQTQAYFGISVATAGDVNGDGFSDMIVGAYYLDGYYSDGGGAFIFHGNASGITTTYDRLLIGNQTNEQFGRSVSSAGDVNGDGYSDIIIGAYSYGDTHSDEGAMYLFHGSSEGIDLNYDARIDSNQENAYLGYSVASAGDVNGDGYSDVIAGAYGYDHGTFDEGAAFLYYGNKGAGVATPLVQMRSDLFTPISLLGAASYNEFIIHQLVRTPFGRGYAKLQWQALPLSEAFSLNPIEISATWLDTDVMGIEVDQLVSLDSEISGPWKWRARVTYDPVMAFPQMFGPWRTMAGNNVTETDLLNGIDCTEPVFDGVQSVADESCDYTGIEIFWEEPVNWGTGASSGTYDLLRYSSSDCSGAYDTIATDLSETTTAFLDTSAIPDTIYYYRVVAINNCATMLSTPGANPCSDAVMDQEAGTTPTGLTNNTAVDNDVCLDTGVDITWAADPGDWGDAAIGSRTYDVLRDGTAVASGLAYGTTNYTDNTGVDGTDYTYSVLYVNGCGYSAETTGIVAQDNVAFAPSGLTNNTATDYDLCSSYTGVYIGWAASPGDWGDNGFGTRTYDVLRDGVPIMTGLTPPYTGYSDETGITGTTYTYSVRYNNGCGFSSDTSGAQAANEEGSSPSGLVNNNAVDVDTCSDSGVQITWTADPGDWGDNGYGSRYYQVYRDGIWIDFYFAYGITSYTDTTGTNGVDYNYTVLYVNGCSLSAETTGVVAGDHIAVVPSGLTENTALDADACSDTGVEITWAADPGDWGDFGGGTRTYDVLRDGTPITTGIPYGTTSSTDTTGTNGTSYTYSVRYVNGCSLSALTAGTSASDVIAVSPSSLSNNTATDLNSCSDTGVEITWSADPGDWGDNALGTRTYDVLRDGTSIASGLTYGTTSHIDTTGENGTTYTYSVRYINGCSLFTDTTGVSASDLAATAPSSLTNNGATDADPCSDTGVEITWPADPGDWGDNDVGTRTYDVLRDSTAIATSLTYGTISFTDTTGTNGTSYTYSVRYVNGCSLSSETPGTSASDTVAVSPSGLINNTATDLDACSDTGVEITWAADPGDWGDFGGGIRTYDVLRDGTAITTGISYGTTSYTDTTGVNGTTYSYSVRYINGCGLDEETTGISASDISAVAPSSITNNTATDLGVCADSGVEITWSVDPGDWGDNGLGTRSYDILRDSVAIASSIVYGTTTYTDTTGIDGTLYMYTIRYLNGCGLTAETSGQSAADDVGLTPTGLVNNAAVDSDLCEYTGVDITWAADPGDWGDHGSGTRTYDIERDGIPIATGLIYGSTSYTDDTVNPETSYVYTVRYLNGCGISALTTGSAIVDSRDTTPCPDIGNTLFVTLFGNYALLTWSEIECSDLGTYKVYGSQTFNAPFPSGWTMIGNSVFNTFFVPLSSTYKAFRIVAVDSCGNESPNK
ncbi:FG-GAP repeat protein [bacterium]|nr:FG-GAP repeat protein [bacterium]